jgi:two-component system sensor histidine kinase PilS (NtrC family)
VAALLASAAPSSSAESPWRTLELLSLARVLLIGALLLGGLAAGMAAAPPRTALLPALSLPSLALAYFALAAALAGTALYWHRHFRGQLVAQLAVDLLMIGAIVTVAGGVNSGLAVGYLLPLAAAALLASTTGALFVCALATIAVLVDAVLRMWQISGAESQFFQAGLYGAALFGLTALLRLLAVRIQANERLAQSRGQELESQLEINRLVIAQMAQGVLVVDDDTTIRAANRAVRPLLGLAEEEPLLGLRLREAPALAPLIRAFDHWRSAVTSPGSWSDTVLAPRVGAGSNGVPLRVHFARPPADSMRGHVIFLEDLRAIEQRAQELKLASMGRLTASITHEIRNPLAAISHANQLLAEQAREPTVQRLTAIVRENIARLDRLVDDVLRVARREAPLAETIDLDEFLQHWLAEFTRDRQVPLQRIRLRVQAALAVRFEPSHLRQVLFNLLDNALRYASARDGAIELVGERRRDDPAHARLWLFDDGPGVAVETRGGLFEPFFTTDPQGTGLGLYIAREFCLANRAELTYAERRASDGRTCAGFLLRFAADGTDAAAEELGFLDTIPFR